MRSANAERDTEYTLEVGYTFSADTTQLVEVAGSLHHTSSYVMKIWVKTLS